MILYIRQTKFYKLSRKSESCGKGVGRNEAKLFKLRGRKKKLWETNNEKKNNVSNSSLKKN